MISIEIIIVITIFVMAIGIGGILWWHYTAREKSTESFRAPNIFSHASGYTSYHHGFGTPAYQADWIPGVVFQQNVPLNQGLYFQDETAIGDWSPRRGLRRSM